MTSPASVLSAEEHSVVNAKTIAVAKPWTTPAQRALALGAVGQRLKTGIKTLDDNTRGGFPVGRILVIGGAPGAGKTTWGVCMMRDFVLAGHHVAILAADEDANGLLIRWGQLEGLSRDALENGVLDEKAALAAKLAGYPNLHIIDADEESATVEGVSAKLASMREAGEASVLFVDSLQTVRTSDGADKEPRNRIDAVVQTLKRAAKVDGHFVVVTSELARGSYRNKQSADQINDLAAFKESGGIEYGVGTALVLRSVPDAQDLVDVSVPKNRLGMKTPFRLRINFRYASFSEVAIESGEDDADTRREAEEKSRSRSKTLVRDDMRKVMTILHQNGVVAGMAGLRALSMAQSMGIGQGRLAAAVAGLGEAILREGTLQRPQWRLASNFEAIIRSKHAPQQVENGHSPHSPGE